MDQTCLAKSGGFGPINVPLFQAVRFGGIDFSFSMAVLISLQDAHDAPGGPAALLTRAIHPHANDRDPAERNRSRKGSDQGTCATNGQESARAT